MIKVIAGTRTGVRNDGRDGRRKTAVEALTMRERDVSFYENRTRFHEMTPSNFGGFFKIP